ncbi:alkaline phosphatase family protein [Phytoactinopolyspora halotolerans]|uniref:Alkaline phosphatase family protein n=1 Tax=Phytoactinopolyspora halotolerans TaxID=1981512 RepID=A0A6L9SA55_9ACTN|nr:ectonucleotide pyrophosphatase/phosphodiesterase [Phytoactinopolyspora halotolerans]NEE01923.1 alkaline phosphatase family protein [Phytoactinopolyspora halotolerans]
MTVSRRSVLGGIAATVAAVPLGGVAVANPDATTAQRRSRHVVLVDWDGFDPDYRGRVPTPNLDRLAARGSLSIAETTFHTVSNPVRASMSTGAYPETHGNVAYVYDPATDTAQGQSRFLAAETIAEALAAEGRTIASVQWYMIQNNGVTYGDPEHLYVQPGGPFQQRVDAAIDILHQRPVDSNGQQVTVPKIPDFLAVYSSDLDGTGHNEGPDSPAIGSILAEHDHQLGRLIQATKDVGIYPDTTFILTSDHGMTAWNRTLIPDVLAAVDSAGYQAEIVTPGNSPAPETEVIIVPNSVRVGHITLRGRAADNPHRLKITATLRRLRQVMRVLDRDDLARIHASEKLGDLAVEARPPWGFALSEPPEGTWRGSHGGLEEIEVPLFLAGAGIRSGVRPRQPKIVDVAPTIAELLGARPPAQAQGRVLSEVFAESPARSRG